MKNDAQRERVKDYLERHDGLDAMTALNELGIMRLAARIEELRRIDHMNILTESKVVQTRDGNTVVAYYRLSRMEVPKPVAVDYRQQAELWGAV